MSIRAKVKTNDEIAELAGSFNDMIDKLVDTQERISTILHGSGDAMCVMRYSTLLREQVSVSVLNARRVLGVMEVRE